MEHWITKLKNNLSQDIDRSKPCLIAVSGGLDSTVLCHLFSHYDYAFEIAHINYGLRTEADQDEQFVSELAKKFQVKFHVKKVDPAEVPEKGIQNWARGIRYDFFDELLAKGKQQRLVLGHHQDDQIEQFFQKALRPSGPFSMGGMKKEDSIRYRPLLHVDKKELEEWAKKFSVEWREDISNQDPNKYDRNWWRLTGIPTIEQRYKDLKSRVLASQSLLRNTEKATEVLLDYFYKDLWTQLDQHVTSLNLKVFIERGGNCELLCAALLPKGFSEDQLSKVLDLASSKEGKVFNSSQGLVAEIRNGKLYLYPEQMPERVAKKVSSLEEISSLDFVKNVALFDPQNVAEFNRKSFILPKDASLFPIFIREVNSKDKMQCFGLNGKNKALNDIFKEEQIPFCYRKQYFAWESPKGILYLENLRSSELTRVSGKAEQYYKIEIN